MRHTPLPASLLAMRPSGMRPSCAWWDGRKATLERERDQLLQRANNFDRDHARYTKRLGEIAVQTQANNAGSANADKGIAATRAHIVLLTKQLVEECKPLLANPKAKPEELKWCHA